MINLNKILLSSILRVFDGRRDSRLVEEKRKYSEDEENLRRRKDKNPDASVIKRRVTVVCAANICRSQIAESIFQKILIEKDQRFSVFSRGMRSINGRSIDSLCAELLRERGYRVSEDATSTQLTRKDMTLSEVILVMESKQRDALLLQYPEASGKVWLLGHWLGESIPDPYGSPRAIVAATFERIEAACISWIDPLLRAGS